MAEKLETIPQTLSDEFLEHVSGGLDVVDITAGLACPLLLTSLASSVASCVYFSKSEKDKKRGDALGYEEDLLKANRCSVSAASSLGGFIFCMITAGGISSLRDDQGEK